MNYVVRPREKNKIVTLGSFFDIFTRKPVGIQSTATLEYTGDEIIINVFCHDDAPEKIIATAPGVNEKFLYEEDCIQVYCVFPSQPDAVQLLLLNANGARRGAGSAEKWKSVAEKTKDGWRAEVRIPVEKNGKGYCGLNIYRFYRGQRGVISAIMPSRYTPPVPEEFPVVVYDSDLDDEKVSEEYVGLVEMAIQEKERRNEIECIKKVESAIKNCKYDITRESFDELLKRRKQLKEDFTSGPKLLWNECHLIHGIMAMYDATGDMSYFDEAVSHVPAIIANRADKRGDACSVRGKILPTWVELGVTLPLITGVVTASITKILRTAYRQKLESRVPDFNGWMQTCEKALGAHEDEWRDLPDGSGTYIEAYPSGPKEIYVKEGSRPSPLNRQNFPGFALLDLYVITGNKEHLKKVVALAKYTKRNLELTTYNSYQWEYEELPYPGPGEDISHASCQVIFMYRCYKEGIMFTGLDMERLANTLEYDIIAGKRIPYGTVRGLEQGNSATIESWSDMLGFRPKTEIYETMREQALTWCYALNPPEREGYMLNIIANLYKWKKRLKIL